MVRNVPDKEIEARHYETLVREMHGAGLTDDQLAIVRQRVDDVVNAAEAMRAVALDNSDEPFSVFTPYAPGEDR